jgi:hypothetical protein
MAILITLMEASNLQDLLDLKIHKNLQSHIYLFSKHRGAFIGYGGKHDFTKDHEISPGVGKYMIPSVWDKYH